MSIIAIQQKIRLGVIMTLLTMVLLPFSSTQSLSASPVQIQSLETHKADAERLLHVGDGKYRANDFEAALKAWQQALVIYQEIQERGAVWLDHADSKIWMDPGEADALYRLGDLYYALGKYDHAIAYYEQYLVIMKELQNSRKVHWLGLTSFISEMDSGIEGEGLALTNIGAALLESNNSADAMQTLGRAIRIWESRREGGNEPFFTVTQITYRLLQRALIAQNKIAEALEMAERARSTDSPTIEQIKRISKEHNATLVEYGIMYNVSFEHGNIHYSSIGGSSGKEQEAELFIWVVKPTGKVAFRQVDLTPLRSQGISLKDLVGSTLHSIGARGILVAMDRKESVRKDQQIQLNQSLRQLHQLLIEPIVSLLPTDPESQVIFIPQGFLFLVPLSALRDASGSYLIQKHTILIALSIQAMNLTYKLRQHLPKLKDVLVVGNPAMPGIPLKFGHAGEKLPNLPEAEKEAHAIATLLNTQALVGRQATKAAVIERMPKARVIHLATHGLIDNHGEVKMVQDGSELIDINIELSFELFDSGRTEPASIAGMLAFAPFGKDDGYLTSKQISDLKLNAELVVLSACNTIGGYITSAGIEGLSQAFIRAGVPSVIVSLWSVPDASTAALMTEFYRNFQQQPNKGNALRAAKLSAIQRYPNPIDWAAFTLIGEAE